MLSSEVLGEKARVDSGTTLNEENTLANDQERFKLTAKWGLGDSQLGERTTKMDCLYC